MYLKWNRDIVESATGFYSCYKKQTQKFQHTWDTIAKVCSERLFMKTMPPVVELLWLDAGQSSQQFHQDGLFLWLICMVPLNKSSRTQPTQFLDYIWTPFKNNNNKQFLSQFQSQSCGKKRR